MKCNSSSCSSFYKYIQTTSLFVLVLLFSSCDLQAFTKYVNFITKHADEVVLSIDNIHMAAPDVLVVDVVSGFGIFPELPEIHTERIGWLVDNTYPEKIHYGAKVINELPKDSERLQGYPVQLQYSIYLQLENALGNGSNFEVVTPYGTRSFYFSDTQTFNESIKVNQVGYSGKSSVRYANLGVFMGNGGSLRFQTPPEYSVLRVADQKSVYSGTAEYIGDDTIVSESTVTSGEYVYRLPLEAVPDGGPYVISVKGFGISYPFGIGNDYLAEIAKTYARGLYYQRCGIELEAPYTEYFRAMDSGHISVFDTQKSWSANAFIQPQGNEAVLEIVGGYHDAGDFDRRPMHVQIPIMMMSYFEAFPDHFVDNQYDIPESGNGIPDFFDEALWGMKVWYALQVTDSSSHLYGGVRAGTEASEHPEYAKVSAASDALRYGTWSVEPEITAWSAGLFAQAARIIAQSGYHGTGFTADQLYQRAKLAWNYLETAKDSDGDDYLSYPTTAALFAAEQLYLTGLELLDSTAYLDGVLSVFSDFLDAIFFSTGSYPYQFLPGNVASPDKFGKIMQAYHLASYIVSTLPVDTDLQQQICEKLISHAQDIGSVMGEGPGRDTFYPQGADKYYGWGAATAQGRYADIWIIASAAAQDPALSRQFYDYVSQYGDYALGLNPLGVSFVTGLGTNVLQSPLHLDSYFTQTGKSDGVSGAQIPKGPYPGILIYGPTKDRSSAEYQRAVSDLLYPEWDRLPLQRRWSDGWSLVNNNEFTVWETLMWNVCMYGYLYSAE